MISAKAQNYLAKKEMHMPSIRENVRKSGNISKK
jgi:hypothetical protein